MAALGLGYLPTGKHSRPGSQLLSVMILTRNWKPPWQACALAKFLAIWLSPICGQASWFLFWLISLQRHGICSYTARSRALYRSGCDWCTTILSRLSQTPSYFPKAWGHSDAYLPANRPLLANSVEKVATSPCRWQNCSVSERGGEQHDGAAGQGRVHRRKHRPPVPGWCPPHSQALGKPCALASMLSLDKTLHWHPPADLNPSNHSKVDAKVFTQAGPEVVDPRLDTGSS